MSNPIDLLFTIDERYMAPLQVALVSIKENNPNQDMRVWIVYESVSEVKIESLRTLTNKLGYDLNVVQVDGSNWSDAPIEDRYPKEMYFRLLAGEILPKEITKVIYMDPDILVINSIRELWDLDMGEYMLAAATHTGVIDVTTPINKVRLDIKHGYYNSGIMVINLEKAREIVRWADISDVIQEHGNMLLLPDQDILNYLYGKYAIEIPDEKWNYDARMYTRYLTASLGERDIHWVMENTVVLHFCGKPKPWDKKHDNRFTGLYLDYLKKTSRMMD
ncbi:glycosyltransferase family 8 protein [Weissella tructae]|uniref:Glycosyltransferase family 8 protein n=3 Tax=Weissella TaxID=46255 RepID=A0A075U7V6_9LACO|nr:MULTISPECIES: glycosyltransferase family 8 protein [Weissella]AIG66192.1 hypothetical protein WS08_1254 [Weissella tructae]AIM63574.1 hypothetical protein WS74_1325 [Weissella ceti]ELA07563.1 putative lipopolysaccharide glycosyltransferase [Weissella ceti NC36]QVV91340.1 glycosyltransferase family 8 protein [Weissella tructae]